MEEKSLGMELVDPIVCKMPSAPCASESKTQVKASEKVIPRRGPEIDTPVYMK